MFFFLAILPIKKVMRYNIGGICKSCGQICDYEVIMTANCLSVFFIPLFKFSKQYYVKTSCCEALFSLDKKTGALIFADKYVIITEDKLTLIDDGSVNNKSCPYCGVDTNDNFDYCPKCGNKLKF